MENLTFNLSGRRRRIDRDGETFIVSPATLIVPGVLNGSAGPIFYPAEENRLSAKKWNGIPVIWNHPYTSDGKPDSAKANPKVVENYGVGFLDNSVTDEEGKLTAEIWFNVDRTKKVVPEVLNRLERDDVIELSTGLKLEREQAVENAVHRGKSYTHIARNYEPDHLAIFTDKVGACSVNDGCGVHNESSDTTNEISHSDLFNSLMSLVQSRFGDESWILEVFDRSLVYSLGGKTFRIGYTTDLRTDDGQVRLSDDSPEEVLRVSKFTPVKNEKDNAMTKEQRSAMIGELISNCGCWSDGDRDVLNKFSDEKIEELHKHAKTVAENEAVANAARAGFKNEEVEFTFNSEKKAFDIKKVEAPKTEPKKETTVNETANKTPEDWLKEAPEPIRSAVQNAMRIEAEEKSRLLDELTANVAASEKDQTRKQFSVYNIDQLRSIRSLMPKKEAQPQSRPASRVSSFFGSNPETPPADVANANEEYELLLPPVMNYGKGS